MIEVIGGALLIMCMRITDVTIGTFRTILVVQGKKYHAAAAGFFEVLIWLIAMKFIFQNLDSTINLFAYASGFAIGNILGVSLEQKVAIGYVQLNIISKHKAGAIANRLRLSHVGVTLLTGEGGTGGVSVLVAIIKRKDLKFVKTVIDEIDSDSFITVQHSRPYRGFVHGARK
ncbi:MAG: DUF2179 domain-containing protein [Melioribacteraceae bacterium]|nr:DUF2179 domain-containing protein [Melioribacteraceae bacterium]